MPLNINRSGQGETLKVKQFLDEMQAEYRQAQVSL